MSAVAILENKKTIPKTPELRPVSLDTYLKRYANAEDGYKYEYNNGYLEKIPSNMKPDQMYMYQNLMDFLYQIGANAQGAFAYELRQTTAKEKFRKPDIAFLTRKQVKNAANGMDELSEFMIEVISPTDNFNKMRKKVEEYFNAGVKIVWWIVPQFEEVHVFTSPTQVVICQGTTLCSADSVIKGFSIPAQDIFKI
jgi:Uma2 family endonuclease